jgi:RND family efflux transporter MFP subunit
MKNSAADRRHSPCARLWRSVGVVALLATGQVALAQPSGSPIVVAEARELAGGEAIRLPGSVVATRVSRLSTSIGGIVKSVMFDLGDRVDAGDTIVEFDDSLARHSLAQAAAAVEEASADAAEKTRLHRIGRNLNARGVITKDQLDGRAAEMRIAQAVVKRLQADEAAKNELLGRHRVVAPFAGVIAARNTEVGEWVAPGASIVELVADTDVAVEVPLPQAFVTSVREGVSIALSFDALAGQQFAASRIALAPSGDVATRSFLLRIEPETRDDRIAPGMSAQAVISFDSQGSVIVVPRDALLRQPDGRTTVWVVEDDGERPTVSSREVIVGRAQGGDIRITSGLRAGERVVVRGNESLQSGRPVRVIGSAS